MRDEHDPPAVRVLPRPDAWVVRCPACEAEASVDLHDGTVEGHFEPAGEDRFYLCDCGQFIEVAEVATRDGGQDDGTVGRPAPQPA